MNTAHLTMRIAGYAASLLTATTALADPQVQEDIRDIRGPIPIPEGLAWASYAGVAALLVATACVAWRIYRWRASRTMSAYQLACARLRAASTLITAGQGDAPAPEIAGVGRGDAVAEAVSDAVRDYIEARFQLRASHKTTQEFLSDLLAQSAKVPALAPHREDLTKFLAQCDLAKFSPRAMSLNQMLALHATATTFVERTHEALKADSRQNRRHARRPKDAQTSPAPTQADGATL